MQDVALTGSRFAIGDSYDEVVDNKTHRSYISQTWDQFVNPPGHLVRRIYHDYGRFESFRTRDAGVRQTGEAFTNSDKLKEFARQAASGRALEVLLEVSTFDGMNLNGKVLTASERNSYASCATCKVTNN